MKTQYEELQKLIKDPDYGVLSCGLQISHAQHFTQHDFSPERVPALIALGVSLLERKADFGHYHHHLGRIEQLVQELAVLAPNWVDHAQLERERRAAAVKAEADAKAAKEQALATMLDEARAKERVEDAKRLGARKGA